MKAHLGKMIVFNDFFILKTLRFAFVVEKKNVALRSGRKSAINM